MLDMCYNVMKPDSGRKSFFSAANQRIYLHFIFLSWQASFWWFYCSSGLFSF